MDPIRHPFAPGAAVVFLNRTGEPQLIASGVHTDEAHAAGGVSDGSLDHDRPASDARLRDQGTAPEPATGLEFTLHVEVTHIASGPSPVMTLAPRFEHPGA